jgi:branched-chain amino acid transport system substrate-binding protein
VTFVKQAAARELFKNSLVILPVLEQSFQDLKNETPEGVIALPRATAGYFLHPDPQSNPLQKEFVEAYKARFGRYPDYPAYRTYQAFAGLKAAYEKAIEQAGRWPKTEEVMKAFEDLTWQTPIGPVTMRADHQAVHAGIVGLSKMSPQFGFAIMAQLKEMSVDQIMPPVGVKSVEWLKTLK